MEIAIRRAQLESQRKVMIDYLFVKAADQDWHGVTDAANDLRDIDTELSVLDKLGGP